MDKKSWEEIKESRKSTKEKWESISKILSGKKFDNFKDFKKLSDWRDVLVHYKEYEFQELVEHRCGTTNVSRIYRITNAQNAKIAYDTAKRMIDELNNLLKL